MKKAIIKSDIVLILLVLAFITIIFLFVDFSIKNENKDYDVSVYKSYFVYDKLSSPISLSYDMINVSNKDSFEKKILKVIESNIYSFSSTLKVVDLKIQDDIVLLTLNEDFTIYDELAIICLTNSILEVNNYNSVKLIYQELEKTYTNTTQNYYINSPIVNKLYTFLYRDKNYKVVYENSNNEEIYLTIETSKDDYVVYNFNGIKLKWVVKKDGLYVDDIKVLSNTYKVLDTYGDFKILEVILETDNTLSFKIEKIEDNKKYVFTLRQGIGLYNVDIFENEKKVDSFKYKDKVFNEG